jgi:hypothetical protein
MGFNAQTEVYENLVQAGVIDPTKVVRTALQDAASVAGLLITTEAAFPKRPRTSPPAVAAACPAVAWVAWAAWTSDPNAAVASSGWPRTRIGSAGEAAASLQIESDVSYRRCPCDQKRKGREQFPGPFLSSSWKGGEPREAWWWGIDFRATALSATLSVAPPPPPGG